MLQVSLLTVHISSRNCLESQEGWDEQSHQASEEEKGIVKPLDKDADLRHEVIWGQRSRREHPTLERWLVLFVGLCLTQAIRQWWNDDVNLERWYSSCAGHGAGIMFAGLTLNAAGSHTICRVIAATRARFCAILAAARAEWRKAVGRD